MPGIFVYNYKFLVKWGVFVEKYSVIDIGSNSIRLLNTIVENNEMVSAKKYLDMTRLGFLVDETKLLSENSMSKSIDALLKYKKLIEEFEGKLLGAYATSAVRDSKNKNEFLNEVLKKTGILVDVISGEEEAKLGYYGVLAGLKDANKILIIDIGGGSTELVLGDKNEIHRSVSLDIGAVRMTDKYLKAEMVSDDENYNLKEYIGFVIKDEVSRIKEFKPDIIVGIGGTITTIGAIDLKMQEYDRLKIHNHRMDFDKIKNINSDIKSKKLEDRKKIEGLQAKRADIIYAGGIILEMIMEASELDCIRVSDFDNLEGELVRKNILKIL